MKKILNILFWLALIAYYFVALSFVSTRRGETICTSVKVSILDSLRIHFVTTDDIRRIVENPQKKVRGKQLDSINTARVEERLLQNQAVYRAEAYKTVDGTLHVDILQRIPVLRIINRYGESYYLDETGHAIRHNRNYSVRVLVANGHIDQRAPEKKEFDLKELPETDKNRKILRELFDLAVWIRDNELWNAQIEQIYVNADGDIELIPLVGSHIIIFGKGENFEEKFTKLETLYRNGFNVSGWNKYQIINLKYNNQIVCTQR
ncbi:MAG: cell division protein FtsQ/DivIB [Bacteroidales bacterium]|jgi:cell division protein FtsQ|nr:cell division protein FtsQ/DivIB [Bacteroidales bacterium]